MVFPSTSLLFKIYCFHSDFADPHFHLPLAVLSASICYHICLKLVRAGNYVVERNEEYGNIRAIQFAFSKLKLQFYADLN